MHSESVYAHVCSPGRPELRPGADESPAKPPEHQPAAEGIAHAEHPPHESSDRLQTASGKSASGASSDIYFQCSKLGCFRECTAKNHERVPISK